MNELEKSAKNIGDYLDRHSWLFSFSNVKILMVKDSWPEEWKSLIHGLKVLKLKEFFDEKFQDCPQILEDFIRNRNELLKDFESKFISDQDKFADNASTSQLEMVKKRMNVKKQHEVLRFGTILQENCKDFHHIIDVGSGAGHLERFLLAGQYIRRNQLICIEGNDSHIESSVKRAQNENQLVKTLQKTITNSLDVFKDIDDQIETFSTQKISEKSCLIGLHSCGDLTNSMISWFCNSNIGLLAVISCCYHKMKIFPTSIYMTQNLPNSLQSHFALRLGCQDAFQKWLDQSETDHKNHARNFGQRVSKEAEISAQDDEFEWLEIVTGLQSHLQILLEYIVMLDRLMYLQENGFEGKLVKVFNKIVSPRNILLWCQKSL